MNIVRNVNGENPKEGVKIVDNYDTRGYESEVTKRGETSTFLGRMRGSRDAKRVTGCWRVFDVFPLFYPVVISYVPPQRDTWNRPGNPSNLSNSKVHNFYILRWILVISSLNESIFIKWCFFEKRRRRRKKGERWIWRELMRRILWQNVTCFVKLLWYLANRKLEGNMRVHVARCKVFECYFHSYNVKMRMEARM